MPTRPKILPIRFFRTSAGREPVRDWLKELPAGEREAIGNDLRTLQFGWPIGMPLVRNLAGGIWEVRTRLPNRNARVLFAMFEGEAVLLHGFMKKSQATPLQDLQLAQRRRRELK